ncbi:ricin-type beta-trefoil lectin domain protein [Streptomyces laurentii]|uniref:ricin-type beta-trefoil lectin domain protein n=1 Tax=Streptomyces laurentii TaxID=39478 RepID=UPI0036B0FD5D
MWWKSRAGRARSRARRIGIVVSAVLVAALLPAEAWALPPDAPRIGVKLTDLQKVDDIHPDNEEIESHRYWAGPATEPPPEYVPQAVVPLATATDSVDLSGAGEQLRAVGNLPVRLGKATAETGTTPPDPSGEWGVAVNPTEAAASETFDGAILKVIPPSTGSTPVDLELDYSRFQDLYGTAWATRLKLVQLPECFLQTPDLEECSTPVDVPSTNDPVAKTIRGTVDPAETQPQGLSTQSGGGSTVLVASDSGAGAAGSYRATSLAANGSWSAGGSAGGFAWSYPLTAPAPPAGPTPQINLSYSSQSVDGRTSVSNGQASWIGDGWDYHPGFVERRYRTCSDDRKNGNNSNDTDKKKSDLCWASDNVVMSLGGSSSDLVHEGTRWVPEQDDGSKMEYLDASGSPKTTAQDGKYNGEHWRLTTRDGTRYYFGRNDIDGTTGTRTVTNSVSKVPVFGNQSGEPCHQATYANSSCDQAWRWNLDYVEDINGNVMVIDWKQEKNLYARNGKYKPAVSYDRAAYPTQILYGLRAGDLTAAPAGKVTFRVDERCIRQGLTTCSDTEFDSANYEKKQPWWDTPSTLHCKSTTSNCYVTAPTFWTRKRLTAISTEAQRQSGSTALSPVDTWTLEQSFPAQRSETHPPLWLEVIHHTGYGTTEDESGSTGSKPLSVSFLPNIVDMPNRVKTGPTDDTPGFDRQRVATIRTETGGEIKVEYSAPCTPTGIPQSPQGNKTRCFPAKWSPDPDDDDPAIEWFNKYVVTSVTEKDRAARQPDMTTTYTYDEATGGAWAKSTDEFLKPELRTYDRWRGYGKVTVKSGVTSAESPATQQSQTVTRYFRGMSRDAGGSEVLVVLGDATNKATPVEDLPAFQGQVAETTTYTMAGGTIVGREVTVPKAEVTATRVRGDGLPDLKAYRVGTEWTQSIETLSDGKTRTRVTVPTYEQTYGLPEAAYSYTLGADGTTKADESCTKTTYVHKNTADVFLIGLPQRVTATVGDCAAAATASGNEIISDVRTSYDAPNAFGTAPTKGLPRQVDTINEKRDDWITTARTEYDALGRVTKTLDAKNNENTTTYAPATGPAFKVTETNAEGHTSTTALDPGRGSVLSLTDTNGRTTTGRYDSLGRVVAVWSPSRKPDTDSPSARFTYRIESDVVPAVTTETLRGDGTYARSVALYDGHLRPRQTQTDAVGGGRIITDTLYNANGSVSETRNGYFDKGEPEAETYFPASLHLIPNSTKVSYDGLSRPVRTTTVHKGTEKYSDTAQYGGDWTLTRTGMSPDGTTPLSGSRAVKSWTDVAGRTVKIQHYASTSVTAPAATLDTLYTYDARGKLATVTDPKQNTWIYDYDVRGRLKSSKDPDMGSTGYGYDELDRQIWTKDSRERTQYSVYDALGRQKELHDDSATGPLVAKWTYDTLPGAKGYPVAATRYTDGAAYTDEVTGYDTEYRPTGSKVVIPKVDGTTTGFDGTYEYSNTYTSTGQLQSVTLPETNGGLAKEKVITRYDGDGMPITTSGLDWYTSGVVYGPYGDVMRTTSGDGGRRVWTTNEYDESTGRLAKTYNNRETAQDPVSTLAYGYDTVGNITSITDTQSTTDIDRQCFAYDPMGRLVHAWTGVDKCPTSATAQGTGPTLAQVSPGIAGSGYFHSYTFDTIGNRASLTVHDLTDAKLDDTYSYTYGRTVTNNGTQAPELVQPHTLVKTDSKVVTPTSTVESQNTYEYDASGNTTKRVLNGDTQSLTWDRSDKVTSVTGFGSGKGAFINPPSGKCLDVENAKNIDGTPIQIWPCNGTKAQQWKLSDGTLKALGKCATVEGSKIVLSACVEKNTAQQFVNRADSDLALYNAASGKCVDVPSGDYTDGNDLQLYTCNKTDAQKWSPGDTTRYVYDAGGNRLIEATGTTRTLFLGDSQITVKSSGQMLNAQRYYTHPGAPTTLRTTSGKTTGHKLTVLLSDLNGTSTTALDQSDNQAVTRRYYDPYGNPRGTEPVTWADRRTFVGTGIDDSTTGLTHVGAREYDPTVGRFLSVDPIMDITDPLQMNGYSYANNTPVTLSDPSGLMACRDPGECGGGAQYGNNTPTRKSGGKPLNDKSWGCTNCDNNSWNDGWWVSSGWAHAKTGPVIAPKVMMVFPGVFVSTDWKYASDFKVELGNQASFGGRCENCAAQIIKAYDDPIDEEHLAYFYQQLTIWKYHACNQADGFRCPKSVSSNGAFLGAMAEMGPGEGPGGGLNGSGGGKSKGFCRNSFVSGTRVRMADGTTKAIEDVETGDKVLATDPETGETSAETVTAAIFTADDKTYVDLAIGSAVITTTAHHPFWVESEQEWLDAGELKPGMTLRTERGTTVRVEVTRSYGARQGTYNLTVSDLHTYYVLAGQTPVLVHNSKGCPTGNLSDPLPRGMNNKIASAYDDVKSGRIPSHDTYSGREHPWWAGSKEYRVPGRPDSERILVKELPNGVKVYGWTSSHYTKIQRFSAPHFPDSGWNQ